MTDKMTPEEIEQRLNKMSEELFSSGYIAGLKSVLPYVKQFQTSVDNLVNNVDKYLRENDPDYEESLEELAQKVSEKTDQLRKLKEDEQTT